MLGVSDALSALLRALSLIFLLQAAGAALFVAMLGRELADSRRAACRLARAAAIAAAVSVAAHLALQAGRMAGDLSGLLDVSLLRLALTSTAGAAAALSVLGLALVAAGLRVDRVGPGVDRSTQPADHSRQWVERPRQWADADLSLTAAVIGAALIVASFVLTGHTSASPRRWILCVLLIAHLLIVAFWFGALPPLYLASLKESPATAARIVDRFSRVATRLVPGILIAGLALAALLVGNLGVLRRPYGELLLAKLGGFALLMGLASLNKWRLAPAMARSDAGALLAFRRSVAAELALIVAVLAVTAVMTTFFSPE